MWTTWKVRIKDATRPEGWTEEWTELAGVDRAGQALEVAEEVLRAYNATRREGEPARELVGLTLYPPELAAAGEAVRRTLARLFRRSGETEAAWQRRQEEELLEQATVAEALAGSAHLILAEQEALLEAVRGACPHRGAVATEEPGGGFLPVTRHACPACGKRWDS